MNGARRPAIGLLCGSVGEAERGALSNLGARHRLCGARGVSDTIQIREAVRPPCGPRRGNVHRSRKAYAAGDRRRRRGARR